MLFFFVLNAMAQDSGVADCAVPCRVSVLGAVPSQGALDVPVDISPQVVLGSDCFGLVSNLELRTQVGTLVATGQAYSSDLGTHNTLALDQPLAASSLYVLSIFGDYPGATELSFTTGSSSLSPLSGAPVIDHLALYDDAVDSGGYGGLRMEMEVSPVPDPTGLGLLAAYGSSAPDQAIAWAELGSGGSVTLRGRWLGDLGEPLCFTAGQFDGSGLEFARSEEACVTPDEVQGGVKKDPCACSSGHDAGAWLGLVALALLRRRVGQTSA